MSRCAAKAKVSGILYGLNKDSPEIYGKTSSRSYGTTNLPLTDGKCPYKMTYKDKKE